MGTTTSKKQVSVNPLATPDVDRNINSPTSSEAMFSRQKKTDKVDIDVDKLRKEMEETIVKMKKDSVDKDKEVERLKAEADEATSKYNMLKQKKNGSSPVQDEKTQTKQLEAKISELESLLADARLEVQTLRQALTRTLNEKDAAVNTVMESVEMVIHEKDNRIRRLNALYDIHDSTPEKDGLSTVNATLPHTQTARFGISAENVDKEIQSIEQIPKNFDELRRIEKSLKGNAFLKNLSKKQIRQLSDFMSRQTVAAGNKIITEGTHGSHLYIIDSGSVDVFQNRGGKEHHIALLETCSVFGELAILYNCKRTATIKAKTNTVLWSLERTIFQNAVKLSGEQRREQYIQMLKSVKNLKDLPEKKFMRVADCLIEETFEKNEYIIRQGESGDTFYIISEGSVKVTKTEQKNNTKETAERFLSELKAGDFFGEMALLREEKRTANVIANSETVTCFTLDRQAFSSLIGSLADIGRPTTPAEDISKVQQDEWLDEDISLSKHEEFENVIKNVTLSQLQVRKVLGRGGFGCVQLVTIDGVKRAFALKTIKKVMIEKTGQQQHVIAERNILMAARSPFIARLHRTFKDRCNIHMLMDAYLGGEVYRLLKVKKHFGETSARFCTACTVEALAYLHIRGIAYRDLKPENLMIDQRGYIKVVDFGFAKRVRYGFKTWTFCGTPEYFPPEILQNLGHDFSADYWSLGVLIYEFLSGTTPFYAQDDMTVYQKIVDGIEGIKFHFTITKNAESLIRSLCRLEPRERLGYQKGAVNDIRKHRWFRGFNWQGLRQMSVKSPIQVDIKDYDDAKYFGHVPESTNVEEKEVEMDTSSWDKDF